MTAIAQALSSGLGLARDQPHRGAILVFSLRVTAIVDLKLPLQAQYT